MNGSVAPRSRSRRPGCRVLFWPVVALLLALAGCTPPAILPLTPPLPEVVKAHRSVGVWAGQTGMRGTGLLLERGDRVTLLVAGEIDLWPGREGYTRRAGANLLYRVGTLSNARRYRGEESFSAETGGELFLGYVGSPIGLDGEPTIPQAYRDDLGGFVVDILVWKRNDLPAMADLLAAASRRDPQNQALMLAAAKFESQKRLHLAEQSARREVAAAERAMVALTQGTVAKPPATPGAAPAPAVTQKAPVAGVPPGEGPKRVPPAAAVRPPPAPVPPEQGEKDRQIAELNARLQKAMQALRDVEAAKRQMADQLAEQQRREEEAASRIEALETERARQPKNLPVIAVVTPAEGSRVESEAVLLAGVAEHGPGIEGIEILLNGAPVRSGEQRAARVVPREAKRIEFSERLRLRKGKNEITLRVRGKGGATAERTMAVHLAPRQGQVWAVVIGIDRYRHLPALKYAASDARAVHRYLVEVNGVPPDHVWLLLDEEATLDRLRSTLGTQLRRRAGREDLVIVYLAGHGATERDASSPDGDGLEKYILPHNADPRDLYASAIPMGELARIFQRISAERLVFVSDTCYSGASGGRTIPVQGSRATVSGAFWDRISQGKGRVILAASDANQVSAERDELGHGVFTYYLLEGLGGRADQDGDGVITLDEVYRYVSLRVPQATGQEQHPVRKGETTGEIVLGVVKRP